MKRHFVGPRGGGLAAALAGLSLVACTQSVGVPGPAGPAGPAGDIGPVGARGPAGDAGPGYTAYASSQSAGAATTPPASIWMDVPGTLTSFNSDSGPSTADLLGSGAITATGTGPVAECALRFVIDGTPTGDASYGDRRLTAALGQWHAFTLMHRTTLAAAGPHSAKVQMTRVSADGTECQIDASEYSQIRLLISVR